MTTSSKYPPVHQDSDIMTPAQWKLAVSGLQHSKRNLEIMRRILVDGEAPGDIVRKTKVPRQKISRWKAEILANYQRILDAHGVVCREVLMLNKDDKVFTRHESALVRQILNEEKSK